MARGLSTSHRYSALNINLHRIIVLELVPRERCPQQKSVSPACSAAAASPQYVAVCVWLSASRAKSVGWGGLSPPMWMQLCRKPFYMSCGEGVY